MAYPKQLSQKTLTRRYDALGLGGEKLGFLHGFFRAAANLYGAVFLYELREVYSILAQKTAVPRIRKKDLIAFSEVARRDEVPYYVFEVDEVYSEEPRADADRIIVSREIIWNGWAKFHPLAKLLELQQNKPFYVPENFLCYAEGVPASKEEIALRDYLGSLQATRPYIADRFGKKQEPSPHVGKKLKDFSYQSFTERFEVEYYQDKYEGVPGRRRNLIDRIIEESAGPVSDKLFRELQFRTRTGWMEPMEVAEFLTKDLDEIGVMLSKQQLEKLIELLFAYHNSLHLYTNRGWVPAELAREVPRADQLTVSFGPGIWRAIEEGEMDFAELKKGLEGMGIKVEDRRR